MNQFELLMFGLAAIFPLSVVAVRAVRLYLT